jgi:hypothetical protein
MMRRLINCVEHAGRAKSGGQIGVNGYFYKGGRFLPNTTAEPGKWKLGKKWVYAGRELIGPGEFGFQPTPFSRSIWVLLGVGSRVNLNNDGSLTLRTQSNGDPVLGHNYEPVTLETRIRPGVKGVLSREDFSLGELIDLYQKGARWIDVRPDIDTITS